LVPAGGKWVNQEEGGGYGGGSVLRAGKGKLQKNAGWGERGQQNFKRNKKKMPVGREISEPLTLFTFGRAPKGDVV